MLPLPNPSVVFLHGGARVQISLLAPCNVLSLEQPPPSFLELFAAVESGQCPLCVARALWEVHRLAYGVITRARSFPPARLFLSN